MQTQRRREAMFALSNARFFRVIASNIVTHDKIIVEKISGKTVLEIGCASGYDTIKYATLSVSNAH